MKRFLLLYSAAPTPPNPSHEGWPEWFSKVGYALVDVGSPMANGVVLHADGSTSDNAAPLRGYGLIQAEGIRRGARARAGSPIARGRPRVHDRAVRDAEEVSGRAAERSSR
jgi:hypothetical protein